MGIINFPPVELADKNGLLAIGGDLEPSSLLLAYSKGIFPWPISEQAPLAWFSPDPRGVIFYDDLRVSTSLKKLLRKNPFEVKINNDFEEIIHQCAKVKRPGQTGTWITKEIINAYIALHRAGHAYCIGSYQDGQLVGGIYGVNIGRFVSGESMFFTQSNASKIALISLMEYLKSRQVEWLDTQMITPVVQDLGGKEIPRKQFLELLNSSLYTAYEQKIFTN